MSNRARYTIEDVQKSRFYQMPKFLFEGEFKNLSNDARVLYSLLKDRHELSISNGWIDSSGYIYFVYTRDDMQDMLGVSKPTVIKAVNDLKKHNLIEEERLGQGRPNHIYLLAISTENTKTSKSFTSQGKEILPNEVKNFYPNDTEYNNTDYNNNQSVSQTDGRTNISILNDINLSELKKANPHDTDLIDDIAVNIKDMMSNKYTIIGGQQKPQDIIVSALSKLTYWHIIELINRYKDISAKIQISNHKGYIQNMIYNIALEKNLKVQNIAALLQNQG